MGVTDRVSEPRWAGHIHRGEDPLATRAPLCLRIDKAAEGDGFARALNAAVILILSTPPFLLASQQVGMWGLQNNCRCLLACCLIMSPLCSLPRFVLAGSIKLRHMIETDFACPESPLRYLSMHNIFFYWTLQYSYSATANSEGYSRWYNSACYTTGLFCTMTGLKDVLLETKSALKIFI